MIRIKKIAEPVLPINLLMVVFANTERRQRSILGDAPSKTKTANQNAARHLFFQTCDEYLSICRCRSICHKMVDNFWRIFGTAFQLLILRQFSLG
jgi:hypothetical protein